jgi:Protein of unknown function (DUF2934)
MTENDIARIRQRAYEIWMDEGTPGDRAEANWRQAEEELAREAQSPAAAVGPVRSRGGREQVGAAPVESMQPERGQP